MAGTGPCVESDLNFQTETIVPTTACLVIKEKREIYFSCQLELLKKTHQSDLSPSV